jgi:RimJ/RimL family protein N-acetyltransferase
MAKAGDGFLQRLRRRILNAGPMRWLRSDRYLLLHAIDAAQAKPVGLDELHINALDDLDLFQQTERWLSRETFVAEARRRIDEEGMRLYTAVSGDVLVHWGWLVPRQQRSWFPYVQQHYDFPEGTAVLFNAYTHPAARGTGLHTRSMMRRIADGAAQPGARWVYTAIESHNKASRAVAARCGFKCVDVLYECIRFGRVQRGRMTPDDYFKTIEHRA